MLKFIKKPNFTSLFISLIVLAFFAVPFFAGAAAPWQLVPTCDKGGCNVCDAIGVGITITKIMLGTLGSAALLIFVYGGFLMFTSRGHSDQVQKGKDALINAVKGVIIVLGSWVIVNYALAMILSQPMNDVKIFSSTSQTSWHNVACKSGAVSGTVDCTGKLAGTVCGTGWVCDGSGSCITKCDFVRPAYSCQDTTTRTGKTTGCETDLCPGITSMQCCPVP